MSSANQITMVSLNQLVSSTHQYRKFKELFNFDAAAKELASVEFPANYKGYGVLRLFKCLLLQFMEDLSDRELERYLSDNKEGIFASSIKLKLPKPFTS